MKKIMLLALFTFLVGTAQAELTRSEMAQRVNQVMDSWRSGGQIWQARFEDANGRGNVYLQYPGRLAFYPDRGQAVLCDGVSAKRYSGTNVVQTTPLEEYFYWPLIQGEIGKNLVVEMLANENINYFGYEKDVVVVDLATDGSTPKKHRMRLYLTATGEPTILRIDDDWLRDLRKVSPKKNPFKRDVL